MQHIEKCTYVSVVHVFEVYYICRPGAPAKGIPNPFPQRKYSEHAYCVTNEIDAPAEKRWTAQTCYFRACLYGGGGLQVSGVTRLSI